MRSVGNEVLSLFQSNSCECPVGTAIALVNYFVNCVRIQRVRGIVSPIEQKVWFSCSEIVALACPALIWAHALIRARYLSKRCSHGNRLAHKWVKLFLTPVWELVVAHQKCVSWVFVDPLVLGIMRQPDFESSGKLSVIQVYPVKSHHPLVKAMLEAIVDLKWGCVRQRKQCRKTENFVHYI